MVTLHVVTFGFLKWYFEERCGWTLRWWVLCEVGKDIQVVLMLQHCQWDCWCSKSWKDSLERRDWSNCMFECWSDTATSWCCYSLDMLRLGDILYSCRVHRREVECLFCIRRSCVSLVLLSTCRTDGCRHVLLGVFPLNILSSSSMCWHHIWNRAGGYLAGTAACFVLMLQTCG